MTMGATARWTPLATGLDDDRNTRLHLSLALFLLASLIVFTPAMLLDPRVLDSAPVWIKPQKFNLSLAVHFVTLALLLQLVPRNARTGFALTTFTYLAAGALLLEFVYITLQAGRGRRSHFNYDTPFEATMYMAMGAGAVLLIAVALVLAIQIWRHGDKTRSGLWLGAILGLSLGFVTTLLFGSYLSAHGRYVGAPLSGGGAVVPVLGWSREYGDLRPAHFFALHLMQTVPLAGWLADRRAWNGPAVVIAVSALQVLLATFLFLQARAGRPIWPL
ncbi:MAG: hypothetical protein AAGI72_14505 [Pseudomonadota bacterium]